MTILSRLMSRLHGVFNPDPQTVNVVNVTLGVAGISLQTTEGEIIVSQGIIRHTIPIGKTTTISQVVASLDAIPLITATVVSEEYGYLLAMGLYQDTLQTDGWLTYPTSILWSEMKAYAIALKEQDDRIKEAEKELYASTADGDWLDYWLLEFFGIARLQDETDAQYFTRCKYEIFAIKANNKALEQLVFDTTGQTVEIKDLLLMQDVFQTNNYRYSTNSPDEEDVLFDNANILGLRRNLFGVYINSGRLSYLDELTQATITGIIEKYRAAGTHPVYFAPIMQLVTNDPTRLLNHLDYRTGPMQTLWVQT